MVWPVRALAVRWSICQAVTPLTMTVSAAAGSTSSGTGIRSAASMIRWLAQAPILVMAANRRPTSAASVSGPTAVTMPTRSYPGTKGNGGWS